MAAKIIFFLFCLLLVAPGMMAQKTDWDLDGDGVVNVDDLCPYLYGTGPKGCPDSTNQVLTRKDWLDSARLTLLRAYRYEDNNHARKMVVEAFVEKVVNITGDSAVYLPGVFNPLFGNLKNDYFDRSFAKEIMYAWKQRAGRYKNDDLMRFMPAAMRETIAKEEAEVDAYLAQQKAAEEKKAKEEEEKRKLALAEAEKKRIKELSKTYTPRQITCLDKIADFLQKGYLKEGDFVRYAGSTYVLAKIDCLKDSLYLFKPGGGCHYDKLATCYSVGEKLPVKDGELQLIKKANDPVKLCTACAGSGYATEEYATVSRQSLPQGYFSGVEVTKTYTTTNKKVVFCKACNHTGLLTK